MTLKIMNRRIDDMMRNDDKKLLYVFEIKHTKWLKKSIIFESRAIYDLNQMSKCSGIKRKNRILKNCQMIRIRKMVIRIKYHVIQIMCKC